MRSFRTHVALLLGGAVLVLWGSSVDWITWRLDDAITITSRRGGISGSGLEGGMRAAGLLALAAVPAVFALRGKARRVLGSVVGLGAGLLAAGAALNAMEYRRRPVLRDLIDTCAPGCVKDRAGPELGPTLVLVGALLLVLAGLTAWRARGWQGLGSSYEAPGDRRTEVVTDKGVWDALDRGDDPTA